MTFRLEHHNKIFTILESLDPEVLKTDCFTSKLLSNSDRYVDASVESRDLIDLAVLRLQSPISQEAIEKAEKADEVMHPLKEAVKRFQELQRTLFISITSIHQYFCLFK